MKPLKSMGHIDLSRKSPDQNALTRSARKMGAVPTTQRPQNSPLETTNKGGRAETHNQTPTSVHGAQQCNLGISKIPLHPLLLSAFRTASGATAESGRPWPNIGGLWCGPVPTSLLHKLGTWTPVYVFSAHELMSLAVILELQEALPGTPFCFSISFQMFFRCVFRIMSRAH